MSNGPIDPFGGPNSFAAFMDKLEADPAAQAGAANPPAPAPVGAPAGEGAPADAPAVPTAGTVGQPPAAGADAAAGGAGAQAQPGADAAQQPAGAPDVGYVRDPAWERTVVDKLGEASTAMATRVRETARQESLAAMRDEYATYFNLVETPPRMLVGKAVPSLDPDKDTEIIRDANDARDYQEAAKSLLAKELGSRVQANVAEQSTHLQVISQSVDMLQKNPDLLRDKQLADRVATLIKPYEYRKDGKLYGWSVNVVPLVDQVRQQLQAERAAKAAGGAPAPAAPAAPAAQPPAPPAPAPQQGLKSSAGLQSPQEGFDQLWSTLGFAPGTINL